MAHKLASGGLTQEAPTQVAPRKEAPSKASRGEGSNKPQDISRPRSMRDLCKVKARLKDEPFYALEIADLPTSSREGPLEARWASLTPKS